MMGVIKTVYQFFAAHPKRQTTLEKAISDTHPTSKVHKLKDMCRTRWVQRIDAIQVFKSLHQCTVTCMEGICNDGPGFWTPDALTDARSLQLAMTTTDFICAVVITNSCLKYLQALTHDCQWFSTVEKMCADVGTEPSLPRRSGRQIHRSNVPADNPSEYYCRSISIPMLDHLLSEIKTRFITHQKTALLELCIVPSVMVTLPDEECASKVSQLADMYQDDLPSPDSVLSELHCWQMKWQHHLRAHGQTSLPLSPTATIRHTSAMYPNIKALISILCTLPVTSCSAERSISGLKRIKTASRSSMTTQRLYGLTLLHVHRDLPIDIEAAVDEFSRHPRRMQMVHILSASTD